MEKVQEVTYNGHTYKIGEFVYFKQEDTDYTFCYFGRIKSIELHKNEIGEGKYDNRYLIETLYTDYGFKFEETFECKAVNCDLRPAEEMLEQLIKRKQDEIQALSKIALTEIYSEVNNV